MALVFTSFALMITGIIMTDNKWIAVFLAGFLGAAIFEFKEMLVRAKKASDLDKAKEKGII